MDLGDPRSLAAALSKLLAARSFATWSTPDADRERIVESLTNVHEGGCTPKAGSTTQIRLPRPVDDGRLSPQAARLTQGDR
jgi:hypothetical protein